MSTMTPTELRAAGHDPYNLLPDDQLLVPARHLGIVEGFLRREASPAPDVVETAIEFLRESLNELEALRSDVRVAEMVKARELVRPTTVTERLAEVEG